MATEPRNVLITGGSRGIGLGLARRFVARGDAVLVTARSEEALATVAAAHPGITTVVNDISRPDERERLAEHVRAVMPGLDMVIDNAGIQRRVALAEDTASWAERQAEIDVLLAAPIHLNHLLIPIMLGHGRPSTIVDVTSGGALVPQPFAPVYSACKAALHSYTATLRHALEGTSCRVVEVLPPAVATGLAGLGAAHGEPVDDFCDAVVAALDGGAEEIGYGRTDTPEIRERLAVDARLFSAGLAGFPVPAYA